MSKQPPVDYIQRTREQYDALGYPAYNWVHSDTPPPFTPLKKPVNASRISLIASGGIYKKGQIAFHFKDDFSYREIDSNTPDEDLRATHFAYDLRDVREDSNVVFPAGILKDLAEAGEIDDLGPRAYTFMGGIYSTRKVASMLAPALADRIQDDEVDLAILVPA